MVYEKFSRMDIFDNHIIIYLYFGFFSYYGVILELQSTLNASLYEIVQNVYIYSIYNYVIEMNIADSYVWIFIDIVFLGNESSSLGCTQH